MGSMAAVKSASVQNAAPLESQDEGPDNQSATVKTSLGVEKTLTLINWTPKKSDNGGGESSIMKTFRERREHRVQLWEERGGHAVEHFYKKKGDDRPHLYIEYSTPEGKKLRSWKDCVKYMGEDPSKTQPQEVESTKLVPEMNSRLAIGYNGKANKAIARKRRVIEVSTSTDEDAEENTECKVRRVSEIESSEKTTSEDDGEVDRILNARKNSGKGKHKSSKESHPGNDKGLQFLEWKEDAEAVPVRVRERKQIHVIRKVSKKGVSLTEVDQLQDAQSSEKMRQKKAISSRVAGTLTNTKGAGDVGLKSNQAASKIGLRSNINPEKLIPETQSVKPTRILLGRKVQPNSNVTAKDSRTKNLSPRSNVNESEKLYAKANPSPKIRVSARRKKTTEAGKKSSVHTRPKEIIITPDFRRSSPPLKKRKEKKKSSGDDEIPETDDTSKSSSDCESMIQGIRKAYKVARKEQFPCKCNCSNKKSGSQGNHCCCLTVLVLRKCFGDHAT